jgi:MFS family permease
MRRQFIRFASAGALFQSGAATLDTGTFVGAFLYGTTGSTFAVGAASALSRIGWLLPQLAVAHFAQRAQRRMPIFALGGFGRAAAIAVLALAVAAEGRIPGFPLIPVFFVLWAIYACVSGAVAIPYNDIIARSIPAAYRSRLFATRFLGGGLLALVVSAGAGAALSHFSFHAGYALVFALGAVLLAVSTTVFVIAQEPEVRLAGEAISFRAFLSRGVDVLCSDRRFRQYLVAQWLGAGSAMAVPFYIVVARDGGLAVPQVATLMAAQTVGALASNIPVGWWGDHFGKASLARLIAALGAVPPVAALLWTNLPGPLVPSALLWFAVIFVALGALDNGRTIAHLGYLMEISPDDRRPAYSGYFAALYAPAWLSPVLAAAIAHFANLNTVFALCIVFVIGQVWVLSRLRD